MASEPDRHMKSHYEFYLTRCGDDATPKAPPLYDEYNAVLDMPAEFYLDTIRMVFQDFALAARGSRGQTCDPADIKLGGSLHH